MKKVKLTVFIGNAGRIVIDFIGWLATRIPLHQTIMCIRELNNKFIQMRRNRGLNYKQQNCFLYDFIIIAK